MHVLMAAVGTRGDVQPFIALALGLEKAGYRTTILTHDEHRALVESYGIAFRADGTSMRALLETDVGRDWIDSSDSMSRYMKAARRVTQVYWPKALERAEEVMRDADAVVAHAFALHAMHHAEAKRIPLVVGHFCPIVVSRHIAPVFFPKAPAWGWLRAWLGRIALEKMTALTAEVHDPYRAKLGLPSTKPNGVDYLLSRGVSCMHWYSHHLIPKPPDWSDDVGVTGFLTLDAPSSWRPPEALVRFLESGGEPPIYIGFGSMTGKDPAEITRIVQEAVRLAGVRAIVGNGWGGTLAEGANEDIFVVQDVPHDWLFPRVRAVVHHGGAGTVAAGLRAGRPTVVAAFFADQPYWGHVVYKLGAGPEPLLRRRIDAPNLAAKIRAVLANESYATNAKRIGLDLLAEDGVANAVAFVQERLERSRDRYWTAG